MKAIGSILARGLEAMGIVPNLETRLISSSRYEQVSPDSGESQRSLHKSLVDKLNTRM